MEIPVFPLLKTNSTARYGYFNSSWGPADNNKTQLVVMVDTPKTLSESYSHQIKICGQYSPPKIKKVDIHPDHPMWIDIIFLAILLVQLVIIWAYSNKKWRSRHKYVEMTEEKKNIIKNTLSSLKTEMNQIESGIKAKNIDELEKLRYILRREKDLKKKLKEIEDIGESLGEK